MLGFPNLVQRDVVNTWPEVTNTFLGLFAQDGFSKLLAVGLTFAFALQTFIIVGGQLRLLPLTGITMPFVSYGGSSIVANFLLLAGLLLVSNRANAPR